MSEEWDETDVVLETRNVTRGYIIEEMKLVDEQHFRYIAFRQDTEGWSVKWDRAVYGADDAKELERMMGLHFPGSKCMGIIRLPNSNESS